MINRLLLVLSVICLLCCSADAQYGTPSQPSTGLTLAASSLTLYVATTGSDSNPCTSAAKCATIQRAVNLAAGYNWQGLYYPTINVANGTYAAVSGFNLIQFKALLNLPYAQQGKIVGNTTTPTSVVLQDDGAHYIVQDTPYSSWSIAGVSFAGTYGAIQQNGPASTIVLGNYNVAGNFTQNVFDVEGGGGSFLNGIGSQGTITSTTLGGYLFFGRQLLLFDTANITFSNAVTMTSLIGIDDQFSGFYFFSASFTNGSNVTCTSNALVMSNKAFFETNGTGTTVDGVALSRANFPGHAGGMYVDAWTTFGPDQTAFYGSVGINTGIVAITDVTGTPYADYGFTSSGQWTFKTQTLNVLSGNTSYTSIGINNTSTGGHNFIIYNAGSASGNAGFSAFLDLTTGATPWWIDTSANTTFSGRIGLAASTTGTFSIGTTDTSISRLGAASIAIGNGTQGDFTGTLKLAHLTATALANSATTSAVCYNTSTGVLTYDGTIGTCTTSDERLKNVGPRIDHALDRLLQINGVNYTWKDPAYGTGPQIGVGAQTVEKVFPELVQTGSDGYKSVDYQRLTAPIIEALRELKADNDNLRACQASWKCRLLGVR
jgi:hypothetical protein